MLSGFVFLFVILTLQNEPPGYLIVCLNATDRDLGGNGEILYDFFTSTTGDGDYLLFTLNRTSGKLYANFTADRETRSMYTVSGTRTKSDIL